MQSGDLKNNGKNHTVEISKGQDFIKLYDWDIRLVNNGLDKVQVGSIIGELVNQRDELSKKMEHITSLNVLARNTVIEADKLVEELKAEAVKNAEDEKSAVMTRIEEENQQLLVEYEKIPVELKGVVDKISCELTSTKEVFNKQIGTVWADCEGRLNTLVTYQNNNTEAQDKDPSIRYRPRKKGS